jgi:CHASE3 domain sensor protein
MNIFNNLKVGQKIIFGYIILLILMVSIISTLLFNLNNLTQDFTFLVEHDQPVLSNAHKLAKLVVDMETGERGFLITGNDEFLEPYQKGLAEFEVLLKKEQELVRNNPPQVATLETIGRLHHKWLENAVLPEIAKRREANQAMVSAIDLQEVLKKGVGKGILDELRGIFEQLEANLTAKGDLDSVILVVKLAKDMVDQETGQRGFIITGAENFLEPYHRGKTQLTKHVAALHTRLAKDADNRALLEQIKTLVVQWEKKAAEPEIKARREMNANPITLEDVAVMIEVGTGKRILDKIRFHIEQFIQIEHELNNQRSHEAQQNIKQLYILTLSMTLGTLIIGLLLSLSISRGITHPLTKLTEMANQIAEGNLNQILVLQSHAQISSIILRQDEIGSIGRACNNLANYFQTVIEDIVHVSQGLAKGNLQITPQTNYEGDFTQIKTALEIALTNIRQVIEDIVKVSQNLANGQQKITPQAEYHGDFVQIKNALVSATATLAETTAKNATQDWLKTGQMQLNQKITGEQEMMTLAKNVITFLTTYLNAQVGAFYMLEERKKGKKEKGKATEELGNFDENIWLKLIASYAYTQRKGSPNEFQLGEGLVGQAALEQQSILVTDIPEDYIAIQSGLGETIPQNILVIPFFYEKNVKGIIEIATLHTFTDIELEFLEQIMPSIGIAVNTTTSRMQMQQILQQV